MRLIGKVVGRAISKRAVRVATSHHSRGLDPHAARSFFKELVIDA
jgi:hypothetical protein